MVRVSQRIRRLLATIDRILALLADTSNGDVLQAISMTLAVRTGMVRADSAATGRLASQIFSIALSAFAVAPAKLPKRVHA